MRVLFLIFPRSFLVCLLTYTLLWNGKYVSISCLLSVFGQGSALNVVFPAVLVVAVPGFIELLFLPGDLSPLIGNRYPCWGCDFYFFYFFSLGLWWKGDFLFAVLAADENGNFEGCLCFLRFFGLSFWGSNECGWLFATILRVCKTSETGILKRITEVTNKPIERETKYQVILHLGGFRVVGRSISCPVASWVPAIRTCTLLEI